MVDVKQVADAADMIVNGYAFTRCTERNTNRTNGYADSGSCKVGRADSCDE